MKHPHIPTSVRGVAVIDSSPGSPADVPVRRIKSALFVDFDNIYSALERLDGHLARRFADAPQRWVSWMAEKLEYGDAETGKVKRDILVRRCYLNPIAFANQRAMFTTSAFQVVDCPPLTRGGKCSTDIHMVMDVLDALNHPTHYDEFIVVSADADFTPLLLRLRAYDRRTVVVAVGPAAQAYRRACDYLIGEDEFIEKALGVREPLALPPPRLDRGDLLEQAARDIAEFVRRRGSLNVGELPFFLRDHFPREFPNSSWFGCLGLDPLADRVLALQPGLVRQGNPAQFVWRAAPPAIAPVVRPPAVKEPFLPKIRDEVMRLVGSAAEPITLAELANQVIGTFGDDLMRNGWQGFGSFKSLIREMDLPGIEFSEFGPGYVFDRTRHAPPTADTRPTIRVEDTHPELAEIAQRVHQVALTPRLPPETYAGLFGVIADQLKGDFAEGRIPVLNGELSKTIRDECEQKEVSVSRRDISFVLKGIWYFLKNSPEQEVSNLLTEANGSHAQFIGKLFYASVLDSCRDRQLDLSAEEQQQLHRWLQGGFEEPATAG